MHYITEIIVATTASELQMLMCTCEHLSLYAVDLRQQAVLRPVACALQDGSGQEAALRQAREAVRSCEKAQAVLIVRRDQLQDEKKALWRSQSEGQTRVRELLDLKKSHEKKVWEAGAWHLRAASRACAHSKGMRFGADFAITAKCDSTVHVAEAAAAILAVKVKLPAAAFEDITGIQGQMHGLHSLHRKLFIILLAAQHLQAPQSEHATSLLSSTSSCAAPLSLADPSDSHTCIWVDHSCWTI